MKRVCVIKNGVVVNILKAPKSDRPNWVLWQPGVSIGDLYDPQTGFSSVPVNLNAEKAAMRRALRNLRKKHMEAGVRFAGKTVSLEGDMLQLIHSIAIYIERNPTETINIAGVGTATAASIGNLVDAIGAAIKHIYDNEAALYDQILAAASPEELAAININVGWEAV